MTTPEEKAREYASANCAMPDAQGEPEQCQYTFEVAKNAYLSGDRDGFLRGLKAAAEVAKRGVDNMYGKAGLSSDPELLRIARIFEGFEKAIFSLGEGGGT